MFSVFLLALALSVDAFAVAFSYGLVIKKDVASSAAKLGAATGAGQFVMPLLGWLATDSVHRYIEAFDQAFAQTALGCCRGYQYRRLRGRNQPVFYERRHCCRRRAHRCGLFCLYRCRILFQPGVLPAADGLPANCRRLCADFTRGKGLIRAFVIIGGCFLPGSRL